VKSPSCPLLLLAASLSTAALAAPPDDKEALPFLENDYPAALAQAKSRGVPVFVDVWAPW
jgi:hypothetical protein